MGIIQKQTLKGSVYSYLGVLIGFLNMGIFAPNVFTPEQIGLTQVMFSIAIILSQFGNMGFVDMSNRLFPWFRNEETDNKGFLGLGIIITLSGSILVITLLLYNLDYIVSSQAERSSLLSDYASLLPLLLLLLIWFTFFDNYVKILYNAVLGTFLRDLLVRILNFVLIALYFLSIIDFDVYVLLFVLNQGLPPVIVLIVYLISKNEFRPGRFWSHIDKQMIRQITSLSVYGFIAGMSGVALNSVDKYLINYYVGLEMAGVYSISFYFATLIMIPGRALAKIAIPVVADAWKRGDIETISSVYRKSCVNQLAAGVLLVAGIIANLHNIYRILPPAYSGGEWVIIFISLSNLANNATGASISILGTSAYYRFHTWLMLLLIVLIVITNSLLIPVMGIDGAALASLISVLITAVLRVWVIYRKTGLWPYSNRNLTVMGLGLLLYLLSLLIPELPLIADIVVRSTFIASLFIISVYFFNLSDEVQGLIDRVVDRVFRR